MKKLPVSIFIACWRGGEAIELCVESILKRTDSNMPYEIHVFDSTGKNGRERAYLLKQKEAGRILLTTSEKRRHFPEAMMALIEKHPEEWICIVESDVEILSGDWLKFLFSHIKTDKDFIVGSYKGPHFLPVPPSERPLGTRKWDIWASRIQPYCMLLNLSLYKKIAHINHWASRAVPIKNVILPKECNLLFEHREIFPSNNLPRKKDITKVIFDICGRFPLLAEEQGFEVRRVQNRIFGEKVKHYEQMSHLRHAGDRKELKKSQVHDALIKLRKEIPFYQAE